MASKFWGGSSSESESESETESSSEDFQPQKRSAFFMDSDSDDEGKKRVVVSKSEKQWEELKTITGKLKSAVRGDEWATAQKEWKNLEKTMNKSKALINKEGLPSFYFQVVILMEDNLATLNVKGLKNLDRKAAQQLRNIIKKNNAKYKKEIAAYKANPLPESEDDAADEDDDMFESDDDLFGEPQLEKPGSKWRASGNSDSDDSSDVDFDESSDDVASKWYVKEDEGDKPEVQARVRSDRPKAKKEVEKKEEEKKVEWDLEKLNKRLSDIVAIRGRRNTNKRQQITDLEEVLALTREHVPDSGEAFPVAVNLQILSAHFDLVSGMATAMPSKAWHDAYQLLSENLTTVQEKNVHLDPKLTVAIDINEEEPEMSPVQGDLLAYLERLDDEFTKSLQSIDPHTDEYVTRLQDEKLLTEMLVRIQDQYESKGDHKSSVRCAQRHLEHLYYKPDRDLSDSSTSVESPGATTPLQSETEEAKKRALAEKATTAGSVKVQHLATYVFAEGDERQRARAMLCLIFHHALHDRFYEARDLMLMSHMQDSILQTQDIPTQILFNRTMAQLGLCAFRIGLLSEAHSCLMDISGRVKELLGQGLSNQRYQDRNPEQDKLERQRQLPYHMHINNELIEAVHLISAMLLEVPNRAAYPLDNKKRVISRTFRRLMDYFERQVFTGPPENTRDVVIHSAAALQAGRWEDCADLLLNLKVWEMVSKEDDVKRMVRRKVQEAALKTFLLTYGQTYDSIGLAQLSQMFELPENAVHSQVSRMIISEELRASWDQPTATIVMRKGGEPTKLQQLALQYADKAAMFVENNERLLDSRTGGYGYKFDAKHFQDNQSQNGGQYRRRNQRPYYNQRRRNY